MENKEQGSSSKTERKIVERNRRIQMKTLCSKLNSLVSHQQSSTKETMALHDQLHEAAQYIKRLQMKLERMKEKKEHLLGTGSTSKCSLEGLKLPKIEINSVGSALQVLLISRSDHQSLFYEIIRALCDEGVDIVNANLSTVDNIVFQIIHAEVGELGEGFRLARISLRLKKVVQEFCARFTT